MVAGRHGLVLVHVNSFNRPNSPAVSVALFSLEAKNIELSLELRFKNSLPECMQLTDRGTKIQTWDFLAPEPKFSPLKVKKLR